MSLKFEPLSLFFFATAFVLPWFSQLGGGFQNCSGYRIFSRLRFRVCSHSSSWKTQCAKPDLVCKWLVGWWCSSRQAVVSDKKHAYVGSANNDWKSLTQVSSWFFSFFFYGMVLSHWWQQPKTSGSVFLLVQNLVEASVSTRKNSSTLNLFTPSCTTHFLNLLLLLLLEWRFLFLPPFVSSQSKLQNLCSCWCLHLLSLSSSSDLDIGRMWNQICAEAWNCGEEEKMDLVGDIHCLWEVDVDRSRQTCRSSLWGSTLISLWAQTIWGSTRRSGCYDRQQWRWGDWLADWLYLLVGRWRNWESISLIVLP